MNEELEVLKSSYNMVTEIKDIKENPVTEAMISLVKSVPVIGGLVDTTATVVINKFQEKKKRINSIHFYRTVNIVFSRLVRTGFINEILETEAGTVDDDKEVPLLSVEGSGYWLDNSFIDFYEMVLKEG